MEQISPEEIVQIYKRHGTIITLEEAKKILAFMWVMANLALDQLLYHES